MIGLGSDKKSQNDTDLVQIMQIIRWFPLHNALHQSEQKAKKYTCKKRHLALVSVMIFGSCHLILFVSSTNYFQIVRRWCCLKSWEVHLLCKLQGVHFAQATNVWFVCTEMAKIWCNVSSPQTPFGGFKQSGQGRDLGPEGVKEYLECKTVTIALDLKTS